MLEGWQDKVDSAWSQHVSRTSNTDDGLPVPSTLPPSPPGDREDISPLPSGGYDASDEFDIYEDENILKDLINLKTLAEGMATERGNGRNDIRENLKYTSEPANFDFQNPGRDSTDQDINDSNVIRSVAITPSERAANDAKIAADIARTQTERTRL
eukprot:UC4_evm5s1369